MGKPKKGRGAVIITGILFAISLAALIVLLVLKFRQSEDNSGESTQDTVIETDTEKPGQSSPDIKGLNQNPEETVDESVVNGKETGKALGDSKTQETAGSDAGETGETSQAPGNPLTGKPLSPGQPSATAGDLAQLETDIKGYLKDCQSGVGGEWSVYVKNLNTGEYFSINNKQMKAASLMKLYIMGAVFDQIENGNLDETDNVYDRLKNMIIFSANADANELVQLLSSNRSSAEGQEVVNGWSKNSGYGDTVLNREFSDNGKIYEDAEENKTSVENCGKLLESIYTSMCVSPEKSDHMLQLLLAQNNRTKIPAGLPLDNDPNLHCANKTGENQGVENDAAIVYTDDKSCAYVLCVMTQDLSAPDKAPGSIAEISKIVYEYINPTGLNNTQTGLSGTGESTETDSTTVR